MMAGANMVLRREVTCLQKTVDYIRTTKRTLKMAKEENQTVLPRGCTCMEKIGNHIY